MYTITHQQLRIISPFPIEHILTLEIHVIPNEHATMQIECIVSSDEFSPMDIEKSYQHEVIKAIHTETEEEIFCGVLEEVDCTFKNNYFEISLSVLSGTIRLDEKMKSKSFQNINLLYHYLIRQVLKETSKASCISGEEWNKPIELPIIQYLETDWEFVKRLASHFHTSLVPEITKGEPKFWFGMPNGKNRSTLISSEYTIGVSKKYWRIGGESLGFKRSDFLYYTVFCDRNFQIGDKVSFLENDLIVCEKHVQLKNDILSFQYVLSKEGYISEHTSYNNRISGATIWGTVLKTEQEVLKIHLDIDKKQDVETAYPYEWAPATGDLFYMMPQIGTKVGLYFYNADERSAKAVRCVRTNGGQNNRTILMDDYEKRILWTEHNKKMLLYPEQLTFLGVSENPDMPLTLSLDDENGIILNTEKVLSIVAKQTILFKAPVVHFGSKTAALFGKIPYSTAEIEAGLIPNYDAAISFLQTVFLEEKEHLWASSKGTVYYAGQIFRECEKIDDAPKEGKFDWGKFGLNILAGLAVIGAAVFLGVVTLGTGLVVGLSTIAFICYDDYKSGNVRNTGEMIKDVGLSLVFAGLGGFGGSGASKGFLSKTLEYSSFIGKTFLAGTTLSSGMQFLQSGDVKLRSSTEAGVTMAARATAVKGLLDSGIASKIDQTQIGQKINAIGSNNQFKIASAATKALEQFVDPKTGQIQGFDVKGWDFGGVKIGVATNPLTGETAIGWSYKGAQGYFFGNTPVSGAVSNVPSVSSENVLGGYTGIGSPMPTLPAPIPYPVLGIRPPFSSGSVPGLPPGGNVLGLPSGNTGGLAPTVPPNGAPAVVPPSGTPAIPPNPKDNYLQVGYNSTDLAKMAYEYRKDNPTGKKLTGSNDFQTNVAVFEYTDKNGKEIREVFESNDLQHSEEVAIEALQKRGITGDQITAVYSEREPCVETPTNAGHHCSLDLATFCPDAQVSYSFKFGEDKADGPAARKALRDAVRALLEKEKGE